MSAGIFLVLLGLVGLLNRHLAQVAAEVVRTKYNKPVHLNWLFSINCEDSLLTNVQFLQLLFR